ncbi:MAG: hypothetical protein CFE21_05535 [Bacteroidetes bacterium B1(2017)]|nr:MAG: hypothetical protein CFE21_05535 [Bacteroidetes bacterium B1(2017)]
MEKTITTRRVSYRRNAILLTMLLAMFSFGKLIAQPLSGSYTVGSGGNYGTISAALAALNTNGVSGPVTMNILPGTYTTTTAISIGTYAGVDATNTLTFDGGSAATTTISGSISTSAILVVNQAKYVTVKNLTISNTFAGSCAGFAIVGSTTTNAGTGTTIKRCIINLPNHGTSTAYGISSGTSTVGYGAASTRIDSVTVDSNTINGGYYGIYLYGSTTVANTYNREIKVRGNTLNNVYYYGMYLYYLQNGIDVMGNTLNMGSSSFYGIYMMYNYNHFTGNNPTRIIGNKIFNTAYCLYYYYSTAGTANPTQIYNNTIVGRAGTYCYGLYLYNGSTYVGNTLVYHNTVKSLNSIYGYGVYYYNPTAGGNTSVMNNIFAISTTSTGYYAAYFATNPANPVGGQAVNNNDYILTGSSAPNLVYRAGAFTTTTYNTASAGGDSSKNIMPAFTSITNDGHLADGCNPKGSPIGSFYVPNDQDDQPRSIATPLIGSDEFVGVNDNIKAVSMLAPAMPITSGSQDLVLLVKNVGANTVTSFSVAYTLNGGTPVVQTYSGTLLPCDTVSMVFTGANQINLGASNAIKVYTYSPNSTADADATNDTIAATLKAPLSGIYTVGAGGNYPNPVAAAADLANGLGGPVIFKVLPGTYTGQVIVNGPIPGASATNTLTWEGDTASTRIITAAVSGQAAFLINGAKYVAVRNLTVNNTATGSVGIAIVGSGSDNNGTGCSITKCTVNMVNTTSVAYGITVTATANGFGLSNHQMDSITIDSNTVNYGYYGIGIYGNTAGNSSFNRNFKVRGNTVNTPYYYGMYMYYIYNQIDVLRNTVVYAPGNTVGYGIYMYYCYNTSANATQFIGNRVDGGAYGGFYLYMLTGTAPVDIINNVAGRTTYGYNYQMYLYAASSSFVRFYHNTLVQDFAQTSATYSPLVAYFPGNALIKNNIFANTATTGTQTACYLYTAPSAANSINYNVYWNAANPGAVIYRGSNYTNANFNTPTAGGDSSLFADPKFISNTNLQVGTCYTGVDLTSLVPADINNVVRNVPPKIGAYENTTPLSYVSSNTIQRTGAVAPGATDFPVLRMPVVFTGCGNGVVSNFYFKTTGTTAASNIASAKVYNTGVSPNFNMSKLVGTVYSPSGAFTFAVNDTVNRNFGDTTNYWLVYDVSGTATNGNFLDATFDSLTVLGLNKIPTVSNPTGNLVVTAPMTYLSSTATHPTNQYVVPGSLNNQLLRIRVITSSIGSPIAATSFSLNTTGGGMDTLNIVNAKLYYTANSSTFAATTLFGSYVPTGLTAATWSPYVITGSQQLSNDTNYFWLTYDIKTGAVVGDSVDAEVTSITINSTAQTPTVTAPAGMRKVRNDYCVSKATSTADEEIWNVTFGTLNNTSTCLTTGGPGSTLNMYSDYSAISAPNIPAGIPTPVSILTSSCGGNYTSSAVIYIDYNQDGLFTGANEQVYFSGSFTGSTASILKTGSITVPCTATPGLTRMRVIYHESSVAAPSCGTYTWGETEDYTINIVNGPATFTNTTAIQVLGATSAGASDVPVLRVPVKVTASPCNPAVITEFNFNTSGTTAVGDITAAKLYKTNTSSVFNTNKLVGTVYSPSGSFTFFVTDTANNDTNNYWLAYDISSSALNAHVIDARFDSVQAFGSYYTPINGNPTGNRLISVPMTFLGASIIHPDLSVAETNSTNNRMLRIMVRTSSSGSSVAATQFALATTGGGNDTANIANAKMYYTGASSTFATTTLFGSYTVSSPTSSTWPAYAITGNQSLLNDTNYFWLTYDIKSAAILFDSVDAELTGLTVGGVAQTPSVGSAAGNRKIRAPYCASTATLSGDEDIFGVQFGTLNNTSGCTTTAPGPGSVNQFYANYTTSVAAPSIPAGIATPINITKGTCGGFYGEVISVYIDLNQDGLFTGTGENVYTSAYATGSANQVITGSVTIPCTATPGITRMRVVYVEGTAAPACGTYGWGETEDYNINIVNGAASYTSSSTIQQTGSVLAGATDVPVLRIPVKVSSSSCNPGITTQFNFNTSGTSVVGNILSAKLYKTTGNTFNTTKLISTVFSPSGSFSFFVTDTANNDTNNYWLAYDVSSSALNGATLDARIDSILVFGNYVIPANNNPTGNVLISVPMTYVSSTSVHTDLSKVETGSINNRMLRIYVQTSASGASINATSFSFSTNGSAAPLVNIANAKVFYTGSSNAFASTTQVGTAVAAPSGTFTITGNQALGNGDNYFWLTYDVPSGANIGDSVDAEVSSITIATVPQTPTVTAPAGARLIRAPYCASAATLTGDEDIFNVALGSFSNASGCTTTAPGPGSVNQFYANYTTLAGPTVKRGDYATINITRGTCGGFYGEVIGVYIDYNQNGSLTDLGEDVFVSSYSTGSANQVTSGTFAVPLNAPLGTTRLRIVYVEGTSVGACGTYGWGETEDYNITITDPTYDTYTWTGVTSTVASVATNWTPNRVIPNMTDKLIFDNSSAPISVTAVPTAISRIVKLTGNTVLNVAGTAGNTITVSDTLDLGTGSKINTGSLNLALGTSAAKIGAISGTGKVYGSLSRWFNSTSGALSFPLTDTGYANRTVTVNYTTFPTSAGSVTAGFVNGAVTTAGLPVSDLSASLTANRVGQNGYWNLATDMGAGTYTATFNGSGFKGVNNYSQLMLINRADAVTSWGVTGTHVTTTGSNSAPVLSRTGLTVLGQFGIGGDSSANPLPVSMLFFNATNVNGDVFLKWATANEINNKGFAVERSVDGNNFKEIGFVKGNGTTNTTMNYASMDENAFALNNTTKLYYRLRQVDFDGVFEYSNVVLVDMDAQSKDAVKVFPNPFVSSIGVNIQSTDAATAKVELVDMQGRILSTETVKLTNGGAYHELATAKQLSSGVYFVNVTTNGVTQTTKVTKLD